MKEPKTPTWPAINLVPLLQAVLCADCELISEGSNGHCVACGSQAVISVSKILGGTASEPPRLASCPGARNEPETAVPVKRLTPQVA